MTLAQRVSRPIFQTKFLFEVFPSSCPGHLYLNVIGYGGRVKESVPVQHRWLLPGATLLWTHLAGTLLCSWMKGSQAKMQQFGSSGGKKSNVPVEWRVECVIVFPFKICLVELKENLALTRRCQHSVLTQQCCVVLMHNVFTGKYHT